MFKNKNLKLNKFYSLKLLSKLLFLNIILLLLFIYIEKNNNNKIKVCVCTVVKKENKYIKEFVEHYKSYKVDKIFIYDNNDINGERFDDILYEHLKSNYVKILNYRGKEAKQLDKFQNCYNNNNKYYDWLIFYDVDEYINLRNLTNIKDFLSLNQFKKCKSIYLNWVIHTDNNLLYYDNRTLKQRFPKKYMNKKYCNGKTIIRGNINGIKMETTHLLDRKMERCNGFGKIFKPRGIFCKKPDFKYYYIDHYFSKSTEEFVNKIQRGGGVLYNSTKNKYLRINLYFRFNKITVEKINYISQKAHLNASIIMKNIKFNISN